MFTTSLISFALFGSVAAASNKSLDAPTEVDTRRALGARPGFHDNAHEINDKLVSGLPAASLVICESLSPSDLDDRLFFMHVLKSDDLDELYRPEDNRKDVAQFVTDWEEDNGVEDVPPDDHEEVMHALKCRDLIISYIHRVTDKNKATYLETFTLPLLAKIDNDVRRRFLLEGEDSMTGDQARRVLC